MRGTRLLRERRLERASEEGAGADIRGPVVHLQRHGVMAPSSAERQHDEHPEPEHREHQHDQLEYHQQSPFIHHGHAHDRMHRHDHGLRHHQPDRRTETGLTCALPCTGKPQAPSACSGVSLGMGTPERAGPSYGAQGLTCPVPTPGAPPQKAALPAPWPWPRLSDIGRPPVVMLPMRDRDITVQRTGWAFV